MIQCHLRCPSLSQHRPLLYPPTSSLSFPRSVLRHSIFIIRLPVTFPMSPQGLSLSVYRTSCFSRPIWSHPCGLAHWLVWTLGSIPSPYFHYVSQRPFGFCRSHGGPTLCERQNILQTLTTRASVDCGEGDGEAAYQSRILKTSYLTQVLKTTSTLRGP